MAKDMLAAGSIASTLDLFNGQPFRVIAGQIVEAEFIKSRNVKTGEDWNSIDLPPGEHHTRVEIGWIGGQYRLRLPAVLKDVTARCEPGMAVVALIPGRYKSGQIRDNMESAEVLGIGLSVHDEAYREALLAA